MRVQERRGARACAKRFTLLNYISVFNTMHLRELKHTLPPIVKRVDHFLVMKISLRFLQARIMEGKQ